MWVNNVCLIDGRLGVGWRGMQPTGPRVELVLLGKLALSFSSALQGRARTKEKGQKSQVKGWGFSGLGIQHMVVCWDWLGVVGCNRIMEQPYTTLYNPSVKSTDSVIHSPLCWEVAATGLLD
jgi:hypothetical protein